ncbi:MAG: 50S ribosomal protein L34e [Methanopyri archaeon]|jgi:large subunit ribosomal protein L34e|nr:50S ribosomal protein L34e [Methanopyri archaeon]
MVRPALRSTTLKKKYKATPGGKVVTHYSRKKAGIPHCAECGAILTGVPREAAKVRSTKRNVHRPYGGKLCSRCTRAMIKKDTVLPLRGDTDASN